MTTRLDRDDYAALAAASNLTSGRSRTSGRGRQSIPAVALVALAGVAAAGLWIANGDSSKRRALTDPDSENFSVVTPNPPRLPPEHLNKAEPKAKTVEIKPAIAVPPPPPLAQPVAANPKTLALPPITAPLAPAPPARETAPDHSEELARLRAKQEAEAERLRQLAEAVEAERQARLKSPIIVFDNADSQESDRDATAPWRQAPGLLPPGAGAGAGGLPTSAPPTDGQSSLQVDPVKTGAIAMSDAKPAGSWIPGRQYAQAVVIDTSPQTAFDASENRAKLRDRNTQGNVGFLDEQARKGIPSALAGKLKRPDALIAQGTLIQGVLETAIQSDLPGNVRAVVSHDVWSVDGRRVLIPAGSRLIGEYRSGIATGQTRVLIAWTRVLTPDGISVLLGSLGTDSLGRSGMTGFVDRHNLQRFGSALLLTVMGGVSQFVATLGQAPTQPTVTTTSVDPVTGDIIATTQEGNAQLNQARAIAAQTASQSLQQLANEALRENLAIPPTIHVNQGEKMIVFVRQDLDFSEIYADPVLEEYRRLKYGASNGHVFK